MSRISGTYGSAIRFAVLAAGLGASPALAANYYWDGNPATGAANSTSDGGSGAWNKSDVVWDIGSRAIWLDGSTAIFGGTAGNVAISTAITAATIDFRTAGYTISGGTTNVFTISGLTTLMLSSGTTTINQGLTLSGNQVWLIGSGHTLALGSTVSSSGSSTLGIAGGTTSYAGTAFSPYKFSLSAGAVFNSSGTTSIPSGGTYTGVGDGSDGTLNVTAGAFTTAATLFLGKTSTGAVNVTGGALTTSSTVNIGDGVNNDGNSIGVLTITGGQFTTGTGTGSIRLGNLGSGSGTINLGNGTPASGTLSTNATIAPGSYATTSTGLTKASIFNFNGGTLQALGTGLSIVNTVTSNVRNGGAVIDSNTFPITLATNLVHSTISGDNAIDGGLTKNGTATLTVSGTNTYTGNTAVNGGTLFATTVASLPSYSKPGGNVVTNSGSTLAVRVNGAAITTSFAAAQLDMLRANTAFGAGTVLGIDTANGDFTYGSDIGGVQGLQKLAANTLVLTGTNTYAGPTTLSAGLLAVSAASLPTTGTLVFNGGGFASSDSTARTISNVVSQSAAGAFTFGAATTYTGALSFTDTTAIPVGTGATRNLAVNVPTTLAQGFNGTTFTTTKSGTGLLMLNGSSGGTTGLFTIGAGSGGTRAGNSLSFGAMTVNVAGQNADTAQLQLAGGITLANTINLVASRNDPSATTTPGNAHILNVSGNNTITLPGSSTATTGGGLAIGGGGAGNIIQSDAGTLTLSGSLAGTSLGTSFNRPYYFGGSGDGVVTGTIYDRTSASVTFGASVYKYGTGRWGLNGNSQYVGGTTVAAGTLQANGANASFGTGLTTANVSGLIAGTGATGGAVAVGAITSAGAPTTIALAATTGGVITAGTGAAVPASISGTTDDTPGTLTTGAATFGGGGTYRVKFANSTGVKGSTTGYDLLNMTTLNLSGLSSGNKFNIVLLNSAVGGFDTAAAGTFAIAHANSVPTLPSGFAGTDLTSLFALDASYVGLSSSDAFTVSYAANSTSGYDLNVSYTPTPEPAAAALFGLGGSVLLGRRRRGVGAGGGWRRRAVGRLSAV